MRNDFLQQVSADVKTAVSELLEKSALKGGEIFVIGCSSSEIIGERIGTASSPEIATAVFEAAYPILNSKGIFLAAQCCEHLNRAIILEREVMERLGLEEVNVVPQPKAGGSFATAAYNGLKNPAAVERIAAAAGMDIGGVLIGMHLKAVAVPVRLSVKSIGNAGLICARTRPKFIGGERAVYDKEKL